MGKTTSGTVQCVGRWLRQYHLGLVVALSVLHIGLVVVPTRDSGRADLHFSVRVPGWLASGSASAICRYDAYPF